MILLVLSRCTSQTACGAYLAVGIFANGQQDVSAGWNGIATPVTGLLYGGGTGPVPCASWRRVLMAVVARRFELCFVPDSQCR